MPLLDNITFVRLVTSAVCTVFHGELEVEVKFRGVTEMAQKFSYTQALQATQLQPAFGKTMVNNNAEAIRDMVGERGVEVVRRVVEISQSGRAPKNDPALFVMALCFAFGDTETKKAARENLSKVARTGTHFFLFLKYATALRGWGRALKTAAAKWYMDQNASDLAYQAAKYRNREGWEHHDVR